MPINSIILETAVKNIIPKIEVQENTIVSWIDLPESKLLKELSLCLLSSSVKYEVACAYIESFSQKKYFKKWTVQIPTKNEICDLLSMPVELKGKLVKYRFPNTKSQQLHALLLNIYGGGTSLKEILEISRNPKNVRDELIKSCPGVGNKQSSMFLRNIGFSDKLAILDTHLIDYLKSIHIIPSNYKLSTKKQYFHAEDKYLEYATSNEFNISYLDSAIWMIMKVYKQEFA